MRAARYSVYLLYYWYSVYLLYYSFYLLYWFFSAEFCRDNHATHRLSLLALQVQIYLLYYYKTTNTD
jgi:hypothetical protein